MLNSAAFWEDRLQADFSLSPVMACEIEFYMHGSAQHDLAPLWRVLRERSLQENVGILKIEKERGHEQHEVALLPSSVQAAIKNTGWLKTMIADIAVTHDMQADFAAKPDTNQPGSGLHVHVHLTDSNGNNVFHKNNEAMSDALKFSIGGLLAWLPDCMPIFAPHEESYARFAAPVGEHTPTTVSWGANNRTVAVRLPDAPHHHKHIEHRVAGADADPEKVIAVILAAMHDGLVHRYDPGPQIYGDAHLPMYHLPVFPYTLKEAKDRMDASGRFV